MILLKLYCNPSVSNPIVQGLLELCTETHDVDVADVVGVFGHQKDVIAQVRRLLGRSGNKRYPIMIEPTSHDFASDRVVMINPRLRDLSTTLFRNNVAGLRIAHVDICFAHYNLNLRSEVLSYLAVVGELISWTAFSTLQLRFSYNIDSVHVAGFDRDRNFTLSLYITNTGNGHREQLTVYTRDDGVYVLDSDIQSHSYVQRYGAALQQVLQDVREGVWGWYQRNHHLVVKRSSSRGGCAHVRQGRFLSERHGR